MYIPLHCKHVAHKTVPLPLPEVELAARLVEDLAFFRTDFTVVTTDDRERACVFRVVKTGGAQGILHPVERVDCLAGWDETGVVKGQVEVRDAYQVLEAAQGAEAGVAVVFGRMDHVMFADLRTELDAVHVYDIVPPEPNRLILYIEEVEHLLPVRFTLHLRDLSDEAREAPERTVVLPCSVAADQVGLPDRRVLFFDRCDRAAVASLPPGDTLAFGCNLGRDILDSLGAEGVRRETICPHDCLREPEEPFITRCCRTSRTGPVTIGGARGHVLHWGASREEFLRAVLSFEAPV